MKSGRSNKFSRAIGHLKSTTIDEKLQLQLLSEIPTNNTQGVYTDEPERTVTTTLNPNLNPLDLTQDDPAQNGRDTSGLFMPDGTILTEEPPGDTSYILGPMAAMYYTWSYPWTMIGYIRQSDRRMVNLGRIDGKLSDWDGSVGNAGSGTGTFSSYGQLTAEQARWFRDVQKQPGATNHPHTYNYYAFYPGPPSQTPDANGRYPCVITGVSKNRTETNIQKPTQKPINPEWGLSGYMFIKNEKTGKWEKKYYYNDGTTSSEISGEMTPDNPFYDAYQRGGGDQAAENGYSRDEIIRNGNEQIQREVDQQARQDYQDTLRNMSDKPLTIDDFRSAADYSAYKNGGGDAARLQGKSVEEIINQGIQNINQYNQDPRISDPMRQDAQRAELNNKNYEPPKSKKGQGGKELGSTAKRGGEKTPTLTPAQAGKIATNVAGGTSFNPSLQAYGGSSKGLGGEIKLGQHGTGQQAAQGIKKDGFRAGSRQNVYGTKGVFLDPSASGAAADDFARAGAAAEAGGRGTAGRTAAQRAADLKAAGQGAGKGTKIPVAYKPGTGSRMNIPGTKYAEVGVDASKATKGARLAQNAITKYPNSAKAQQLITKGATTAASKGAARTVAKTLGKAVPFAGAAISVADATDRFSKGDIAGGLMSGLTAVPGPIGWTALGAQIVYDTARANPTSSIRGRSGAKRSLAKEEKEYGSYQDYVDISKETLDKKNIKLDKGLLDVLKTELGLNDKLSDEDKEYLVDLFDNSEDVNPEEVSSFLNKIIKKLSSGEKKVSKSSLPRLPKRTNKDSSINESQTLDVIKNIKKPYTVKEVKQEKLKGYRPKTYGKLHAQYDTLMQKAENPASFKQMDETAWTRNDKYYNERLSQERKNEVLDHLGTGDHYWDLICETGKNSREKGLQEKYGDYTLVRKEQLAGDTLLFLVDENGKKESILQSEYSDRIARQIEEPLWEQETLNAPNDPLIKRVRNKLATQIDYPDKPSPMGYPDGATPQQVAGWHPEYGKRAAYYNALDPQSADAMPPTGDPETDVKVDAQKTPLRKKSKKELKAEARLIQSDWKNEIQIPEKKLEEEVPTFRKLLDVTKERGVVSEKMSTSSAFIDTLNPSGDEINHTISVNNPSQFDSVNSGAYENNNGNISNVGNFDYTITSGTFNGALSGQDAFTFSVPFNQPHSVVPHRNSIAYLEQNTSPFVVNNDRISFNAIAGDGTHTLGSNGGIRPSSDLAVYVYIRDSNGNLDFNNMDLIGSVPKTTSTLTNFEFEIPKKYFGKEAQIMMFANGSLRADQWLYQRSVPWHPSGVFDMGVAEEFFAILNHNIMNPASGWPGLDKTTIAYFAWVAMQKQLAGPEWNTDGSGVVGHPAPVSGGTRTLSEQDSEGNTLPNAMTRADLEYIVNYIETNLSQYRGMTATTYGITNLNFKRQTPMNVFVGLDDPEANAFIRLGNLDNLSPEGRKKALQEMLDAGDEFMIEYLGLKPSTARPVEMGDEIAGWGLRPDGTSGLNNPGDEVFDPATKTKYKLVPRKGYGYNQWVPVQKAQHVPTDARDYTDQDDPINDGDFPDDPFDDSDFPDLDIPLAKGKKSQYAHYQPEGDVISEKKKLKNPEEILKKLPGYYDGKPSPGGFPLSPPVIPVDGQHPELINPVKVANRFNRLDPISAKSMPLTGNPHIDKKVKAARKKPK